MDDQQMKLIEEHLQSNTPVGMAEFETQMPHEIKGNLPQSISGNDLPDEREAAQPLYDKMEREVMAVKGAIAKIEAIDPDVPAAIKSERKAVILADLGVDIEQNLSETLREVEIELNKKVNRHIPEPKKKTEIQELTALLRAQEVRGLLRNLEPGKQAEILFDAAQAGQTYFLDAVRDAPLPIVDADVLERTQEIFNNTHRPEMVRARSRNDQLMSLCRAKIATFLFAVKNL